MPGVTRSDLERVGLEITPDVFEQLVIGALRDMPPLVRAEDPAHDLAVGEIAVLQRGGFDLSDAEYEPTADPLARGIADYATLLATALTSAQAAARMGIDPSRVRHRLADRTLYGVKTASGWRIPTFQLDPVSGRDIPDAGALFASLDQDIHPVSVQRWFLSADPELEIDGTAVSPREWLRHGGAIDAIAPLRNLV